MKPARLVIVFLSATLFLATGGNAQKKAAKQGGDLRAETGKIRSAKKLMKINDETEKRKKLIRDLYENVLNNRKFELLDELVSDDFVGVGQERGAAGFRKNVKSVIDGFPDIKWIVEDVIAEGDRVAIRWSWTATHTRPFRGFPATNKPVADTAIVIYEFKGDKIFRAWIQSDRLGVLQQIGVIRTDLISNPSELKPRE